MEQARRLFVHGYSVREIAEQMDVHYNTLLIWKKELGFEQAKQQSPPSLVEIIERLNADFAKKIEEGGLTPDGAAKYAAALEKLTDRDKLNFYLIDAFSRIKKGMHKRTEAASKGEKQAWVDALKKVAEVIEEERERAAKK